MTAVRTERINPFPTVCHSEWPQRVAESAFPAGKVARSAGRVCGNPSVTLGDSSPARGARSARRRGLLRMIGAGVERINAFPTGDATSAQRIPHRPSGGALFRQGGLSVPPLSLRGAVGTGLWTVRSPWQSALPMPPSDEGGVTAGDGGRDIVFSLPHRPSGEAPSSEGALGNGFPRPVWALVSE